FSVTASSGNVSNSASVNVTVDNAPFVVTAAAASPNPVSGTTTSLSVLGGDDGGEANLTYTWFASVVPTGATAPTFDANNGTNAGKNTTATFVQSGVYTLTVTISDGGKSTTSSVDVNVGVTASTPTVAQAASANPSPVTGTTTGLSVLGNDANGEANL